jgi:phosphoribosyl-ATP pyrophosphohydrolase/phosphoribosyl-AMP cyclohydrolase
VSDPRQADSALHLDLDALRFDERGLLPVVVQDVATGAVRMLGWANREALERTLESGRAWFWSRSRQRLWEKGESSGNHLDVLAAAADCDGDAVLLRVRAHGPTCHTGAASCFDAGDAAIAAPVGESAGLELGWLAAVIASRRGATPSSSYTARLLAAGAPAIAQKVGEEATEVVVAALAQGADRLAEESADLLYHLLVLLADRGVAVERVAAVLAARHASAPAAQETSR